jgi:hypothetical protein
MATEAQGTVGFPEIPSLPLLQESIQHRMGYGKGKISFDGAIVHSHRADI